MAKLILHSQSNLNNIAERRLLEDFALLKQERLNKAFRLMKLALMFKNTTKNESLHMGMVLMSRNKLIEEKSRSSRPKDKEDAEQLKKLHER